MHLLRSSICVSLLPAVLLAFAAAPRTLGAQPPRSQSDRLTAWLAAVESHQPGDPKKLAIEVSAWSGPDLERTINAVRRHARDIARTDPAAANELLMRGAVMHADLGRLVPDESTRRLPTQQGIYVVRDGRWQAVRYSSVHWTLGRALVDAIMPEPSSHPGVLTWYRQTSADLIRLGELAEALGHLTRARELFPSDAAILFSSGVLHERFSSPDLQAAAASLVEDKRETANVTSARKELGRAQQFLQRALAGDPANIEARVRHGRILGELGRHREAAEELRLAIASGASGPFLFYAHLFLGRQEEALGRLKEAEAAFFQASALYPRAQTPRLALSQIARRRGDREKAQAILLPLASFPANERQREDPWWQYYAAR